MTSRGPFQNSIFSVSMPDILTRVSVCTTSMYVCMKQREILFKNLCRQQYSQVGILQECFVASRILLYLHTGI